MRHNKIVYLRMNTPTYSLTIETEKSNIKNSFYVCIPSPYVRSKQKQIYYTMCKIYFHNSWMRKVLHSCVKLLHEWPGGSRVQQFNALVQYFPHSLVEKIDIYSPTAWLFRVEWSILLSYSTYLLSSNLSICTHIRWRKMSILIERLSIPASTIL